jgi:hypothetical protein
MLRIGRAGKKYMSTSLEAYSQRKKKNQPHHTSMTKTSTEEHDIPKETNF